MSFSPDRRWWWDGARWVEAVSQDGKWRWDGGAWVPAGGAKRGGPLRAIFGLGPIFAGLVAGAIFWITTHDMGLSLERAALTWAGLAVLRLLDPVLAPLWRVLGRVPGIIRFLAAVAVAAYYSINQLGPQAAGQEIEHFQAALYVSIGAAYLLLRPSRGGYEARA